MNRHNIFGFSVFCLSFYSISIECPSFEYTCPRGHDAKCRDESLSGPNSVVGLLGEIGMLCLYAFILLLIPVEFRTLTYS